MTVIFRKLNQKRYWDNVPWLGQGDTQADATKCLATTDNSLLVFVLDEPDKKLERIVAALASTRDYLTIFDLAMFPEDILKECGIKRNKNQADTPDLEVNGWHENLIELTMSKVALLASAIKRSGQIKRYNEKKVETTIKNSLSNNFIDPEQIKPKLADSLRKLGFI